MSKTLTIIKREYLSRVAKKSFLLTTLLVPLLIFGFYALIIFLVSKDSTEKISIGFLDKANILTDSVLTKGKITLKKSQLSDSALSKEYSSLGFNAALIINKPLTDTSDLALSFYSKKEIGIEAKSKIEDIIEDLANKQKLKNAGIDENAIRKMKVKAELTDMANKEESSIDATAIKTALGYICGFLIYITLLIYGSMVMRGVMEEKINRISEIMVSSVKPFQMMVGKIVGIGLVGLTQFLIWILLMMFLSSLLPLFLSPETLGEIQNAAEATNSGAAVTAQKMSTFGKISSQLKAINIPLLIGCFIFYFLGGYLVYGALFAAVGSMVSEDQAEGQQLTFPISMPIILATVILIQTAKNPHGSLSIFASIFPLTSPIVMMGRITFLRDGLWWQLALSMILLIATFFVTAWLAGKIYRAGVLMYGKKVTFKEMFKALKNN